MIIFIIKYWVIINFIIEQLKRNANNHKRIEYIIRVVNNLPNKFMDNINSINQLRQRLHYVYTKVKAGNNNFDREKNENY
jgi:hypothetical protein